MPKFRKKPVVIEAFHMVSRDLWESEDSEYPDWLQDAIDNNVVQYRGGETYIQTLEGEHHASMNDWIIQGVKGELYPIKPDIFEATYEAVE